MVELSPGGAVGSIVAFTAGHVNVTHFPRDSSYPLCQPHVPPGACDTI